MIHSCGNPTSITSSSLIVPENNEVSTNLCVFKCDGDLANYVCMAGDCPDNYGGCKRAFWYVVSADGCGELASHSYDAGGQKVEDQESAHVSINGNAMHQVSQELVKSRLQAQNGSMVSYIKVRMTSPKAFKLWRRGWILLKICYALGLKQRVFATRCILP